ncbi:MAG: hypothetical protein H7228_09485 [Polaromonas sp.]|nr:hypothetical protein [Polaromonas sp.]
MPSKPQRFFIPAVLWLAVSALGCVAMVRLELNRLRDDFETNARIAHRLLSQRAVQHDAVMAMLALIQPAPEASWPEQRLPSVYPQIIGGQRRDRDAAHAGCGWDHENSEQDAEEMEAYEIAILGELGVENPYI